MVYDELEPSSCSSEADTRSLSSHEQVAPTANCRHMRYSLERGRHTYSIGMADPPLGLQQNNQLHKGR